MAEGRKGATEEHAGAGIAHDRADSVTVGGRITGDVTSAATRFRIAFGTVPQALTGIVQKTAAVITQGAVRAAVVPPAVHGYHPADCQHFPFYAFHTVII